MTYTIKQVADRFHMTPQAIRYYEKAGLLRELERNESGVRIFHESDMEWISLLRCLRETGMNIKELQQYVQLWKQGERTMEERKRILLRHKSRIEKQIESLQCNLKTVQYKIELCEKGIV